MSCPLCKGDMVKGKTNLTYEIRGKNILVVSDVPARLCKQCGESFIDIEVVRKVEKIVSLAERDGVTFGLVKYREAA